MLFEESKRMRADAEHRPTLPHVRWWVREIMAVLYVVNNRQLMNLIVSFQRNPLLADREKTAASIIEEGLAPKVLIYLLVTNVAWEELSRGRYHIYRGILGVAGKQLLRSFTIASEKMVECGHQDQQTHERELAALRQSIKEAG